MICAITLRGCSHGTWQKAGKRQTRSSRGNLRERFCVRTIFFATQVAWGRSLAIMPMLKGVLFRCAGHCWWSFAPFGPGLSVLYAKGVREGCPTGKLWVPKGHCCQGRAAPSPGHYPQHNEGPVQLLGNCASLAGQRERTVRLNQRRSPDGGTGLLQKFPMGIGDGEGKPSH